MTVLAVGGLGLILLVLVDAFEAMLLPRRVGRGLRFARLYFVYGWKPWIAIAQEPAKGETPRDVSQRFRPALHTCSIHALGGRLDRGIRTLALLPGDRGECSGRPGRARAAHIFQWSGFLHTRVWGCDPNRSARQGTRCRGSGNRFTYCLSRTVLAMTKSGGNMRATIAALTLAFLATTVHGADQPIFGSQFLVKNPSTPERRSFVGKAKEKSSPNSLVGDPVVDGATLTVRAEGDNPTAQTFLLPQGTGLNGREFWSGNATTGYKYKDSRGEQGPIKYAQIKKTGSGISSSSSRHPPNTPRYRSFRPTSGPARASCSSWAAAIRTASPSRPGQSPTRTTACSR